MVSPYRESALAASHVEQEIQEAVALLYQLRRWHPVIAGGALWSWAANRRARDVDIFLQSTFFSRRTLARTFGPAVSGDVGAKDRSNNYSTIVVGYPIQRFTTALCCGTLVDLILTPWKDGAVTQHFDYAHCAVAFGPKAQVIHGAIYYGAAQLEPQHLRPRDEALVKSKLQPSLWGSADARFALARVMERLMAAYAALKDVAS